MPGTNTEKENLLSLLSIEVLISDVHINLGIECHLPCLVFRLLDYPAVSIPYFDQWQLEDFHQLKKDHPNISWRQLLSDQFYELRSANGKFRFKRGKSCLLKTYFQTLYAHLLNVPLFLLLIDQINDNTTQFIGSCNVKLNELIEVLNQSIIRNGKDIPLVEQQTFRCTLFNLMGATIGTCDLAVRFCHYGTTILTHLPMLNDELVVKTEKKIPPVVKEQAVETTSASAPLTDTFIKQIQFVNEKKNVGIQISRSDLPSSTVTKSAQTRWTSTKTRPNQGHQYLRTMEDPSLDDSTLIFYQPPALYFNSDSDFLQMMTPATSKLVEEAKDNRLSYLASIPIVNFSETPTADDVNEKRQPKRKLASNVRFNLSTSKSSSSIPITPRTKSTPKSPTLANDFLQNFPLLRSLVEEALALQRHQDDRPYSVMEQRYTNEQQHVRRPKSATNVGPIRAKSAIIARNTTSSTRRLYPPPMKANQMRVTKHEVRNLVDRLSKPKFNRRIEDQIALIDQGISTSEPPIQTPRAPSKTTTSSLTKTTPKAPLPYGTTRAHRLMVEFSRARRTTLEPQAVMSPKAQTPPRKVPLPDAPRPLTQLKTQSPGTVSHSSLLNKVDVDTVTFGKNSFPRRSLDTVVENTRPSLKSPSTTSHDVTLKLNQTLTKTVLSTPEPSVAPQHQENDDLTFSITDITDYFTDGGESSTRPPTRQST